MKLNRVSRVRENPRAAMDWMIGLKTIKNSHEESVSPWNTPLLMEKLEDIQSFVHKNTVREE